MERVESRARSAPFLPLLDDKGGSDKDSVGRGSTELNKPVSLMMFTADKKQSLNLPPSLFAVKKLYQIIANHLMHHVLQLIDGDGVPSPGSWTPSK